MDRIWLKSWPQGVPHRLDLPQRPLHTFLKDHARQSPDRLAIQYYGRGISFGELDEQSDRLAAALVDFGLKKGDRVSLFLENCPQFVMAYYAVLKAGGIVVAANPMFKEDELRHEILDSGAKIIFALDHLYPKVKAVKEGTALTHEVVTSYWDYLPENPMLPIHPSMKQEKVFFPDTFEFLDLLQGYNPEPPDIEINCREDLALLQYTSGTTGLPKGAMITHHSLLHNTVGSAVWMGTTSEDVVLSVLPFFHVTGMIHSMNMPLFVGGSNVMLSRFDTETVVKAIDLFRCTVWQSITTTNVAVVNFPEIGRYDLRWLRRCASGGAPVPEEILRKWRELVGTELVEGYGLSEAISQTHVNPVSRPKYGSIGIPHFDVDCRIVDVESGKDLPLGAEGELLVKGPMVMKGYWNLPAQTADALRDGWLATGDIAKVDEEGFFYLVGRKKDMIKASGYSVFPAEVEALIYEHPAVEEVAVIGVSDPYRGENIKAFVVLRPEFKDRITESDLISWAKKKMAAYKYPRIVEFVEELPKTGSGKILKRVLRERETA
jgi:acyl-CoA synthetase (AMP-forming)/AMP-acid ligase II